MKWLWSNVALRKCEINAFDRSTKQSKQSLHRFHEKAQPLPLNVIFRLLLSTLTPQTASCAISTFLEPFYKEYKWGHHSHGRWKVRLSSEKRVHFCLVYQTHSPWKHVLSLKQYPEKCRIKKYIYSSKN